MVRVKREKLEEPTIEGVDLRKHVSLLSQLDHEQEDDDRQIVQRAGQFFEERQHSYFFAAAPAMLKHNFLNYSDCLPKDIDGLIFCLWQYSILGNFYIILTASLVY